MPNPPDPVAFTVFGIDIMWYAVMITSGTVSYTHLDVYKRQAWILR